MTESASPQLTHSQLAGWGRVLPWVVVGVLGVLFGVGFSWLSVLRHEAFQSHAFDLGNMDQAVWNTLHGSILRFTDMQLPSASGACCRQPVLTNRLAIHVEPILVPLSLLYLLHAGPETLLVLQSLVVATGVVPAYLLAQDVLGRPWLSLVFPVAYVLHPSLQNAVLDDFHAVTMSAALLLWAMYFLQRDAMPWFWIMALLAAATKEEVGLLIALFGVPLLLRHRVQGAIALVAGIAWFLIAVMVIIPHFNPGGQSPYLARYGYLGSGLHGIIAGMLRHPDLVWRTLSSASRVTYLDALLDPVGFVALPGLPVFLLSAPALVINMLSTDSTMYSGFYQYSAEIVPYIVAASVAGVCVVDRGATRAWHGELLAPLACALVLVASAVATRVYGFTPLSEGYVVPSVGQHQRTEQRLIGAIPPGAVVAAADEVEPHLADRRTVYLLPTVHPANGPPAEYIALDASIPALPIEPSVLRAAAVRALRNGYGVQAADDGVLVLRRGAPRRQLPRSFYIFMFGLGRRTTPERASWGPLHLVGVTIHPSYGWVNRSRPAVEVETYWRVFRTLPPGVEVRLSASPVDARSTASFGSWTAVEDSPTWDWLPLDRWPVHRTVHAALIPITLPTERAGTVRLAIAVAGLGHVHGLTAAQRIPGSFTALRIGTIDVRP